VETDQGDAVVEPIPGWMAFPTEAERFGDAPTSAGNGPRARFRDRDAEIVLMTLKRRHSAQLV